MVLRDYQETAISNIRNEFANKRKRIVLRSEVASGKTVMFSHLAKLSMAKGNNVMVVCNRQKLVRQSAKTLMALGLKPTILMQSKLNGKPNLIVASADTLRHREWPEWVNMVIIDECHLASFTYVLQQATERNLWVLGVSATPVPNKSNRLHDFYQSLICTKPTSQHILDGELMFDVYVKAKYSPDTKGLKTSKTAYGNDYSTKDLFGLFNKPKVYDDMIANYIKYAPFKKAVCFCTSVEHSKLTAENFRAHGISAAHIDGNDPEEVREKVQADFEAGKYHVLCNCAIYTFGWDCPSVEVVIVNRATASYELWRQMIGRGARPFEGKTFFIVIDQGGNYDRHGSLVDELDWSLEFEPKKKSAKKKVAPMKLCKHCEAIIPAQSNICPICKQAQPQKAKSLATAEFELVAPTIQTPPIKKTWPKRIDFDSDENFVKSAIQFAADMKYHANAALNFILAQTPAENKVAIMQTYSKVKNYKPGWSERQMQLRTSFIK